MPFPVYATAEDLAAEPWLLTAPPSHVNRLLATASRVVRRATMTAVYRTDVDDYPTDSTLREAMRQATCAQVAAWAAAAVDPLTGSVQTSRAVASKSLGSGSISYETATAAVQLAARAEASTALTPDAYLILSEAGLVSSRPGSYR